MSDSDSELLTTNNLLTRQNESTIVSAKGPHINKSIFIAGPRFRHNVSTSTMIMPRNYESNFNPRSLGFTRETSPMSVASACDVRQRNYNNSFYPGAMSSQRSVCNGRAGSPTMSMRSIDSNATVSAADIVMALKNSQFSKNDRRMIQEAYNKFRKHKARSRIEKRRNLRLFLKSNRRKSGYDSGDLGSNSSISSDDNRSTRTLNYKNMSSCRSTKTDISHIRRNIKESNMFNDCTNHFKQKRMMSMVNGETNLNIRESNMFNDCTNHLKQKRTMSMVNGETNLNSSKSTVSSFHSMIAKPTIPKSLPPPENFNKSHSQSSMNQNTVMMTQRDRFKNGFLLPSQRFNRSVAATSIPETFENPVESIQSIQYPISRNNIVEHEIRTNNPGEPASDEEEIFSKGSTIEKPVINQRKRSIDKDNVCLPNLKRPKVTSPYKKFINSTNIEKVQKDFEFAKPAFPVRKSANLKSKEKIISTSTNMNPIEKLISKSPLPTIPKNPQTKDVEDENEKEDNNELPTTSLNNTDVSMRPSFIKRKLFSQNMDVTEKITDIAANSPQNSVYGKIQKEKNKARKLVTSQYCLRRDIQTEDNNLQDLIHKIVPSECMNVTSQTNKTTLNNKSEDKDNWDVSSIVCTRNNDEDLSDTFTDEDTMIAGSKAPSPKTVKKVQKSSPRKVENLLAQKHSSTTNNEEPSLKVSKNILAEKNDSPKKGVQKYIKSFWYTDFESDAEFTPVSRKENKKQLKENNNNNNTDAAHPKAPKIKYQGISRMFPASNITIMNTTIDSTQKFNNTNMSFKVCSHSRSSQPKNNSEKVNKTTTQIEPLKKKTTKTKPRLDITELETNTLHVNKKQEKQNLVKKKSMPKKQGKAKTIKDKANTTLEQTKEKESKKSISQKVKILADENTKPQNKKSHNEKNKDETNIAQNKTIVKKCGKSESHKFETNMNKTINKSRNKRESPVNKYNNNLNTVKQQENEKNKTNNDGNTTNTDKNKDKPKIRKTALTKLSDSLIYEDSFTESNNNSIRPVRSCRISKQNDSIRPVRSRRTAKQNNSLNTHEANQTLNVTLRSRVKNTEETKPTAKTIKTKGNKHANLLDLSFSLAYNKQPSNINPRLLEPKEIDSSDVSFTITNDKDSLPRCKGKSAKCKQLQIILTPLSEKILSRAKVSQK